MSDLTDLQRTSIDQFIHAIEQKGLAPPKEIIKDGRRHYFQSDKRNRGKAGWYIYNDDAIPHGSFGDYRTDTYISRWTADQGRPLTNEEIAAVGQARIDREAAQKIDKEKRNAKAAAKALHILKSSAKADNSHPYLLRKMVQAHANVKAWHNPHVIIQHDEENGNDYLKITSPNGMADVSFGVDLDGTTAEKIIDDWQNVLILPRYGKHRELTTIQFISKSGEKKFLSGGKTEASHLPLGDFQLPSKIIVAEGYATAATIFEATGIPTVAAFSANNLVATAKALHELFPKAQIIMCADDDYKTKGNPGVTDATKAAQAVGGAVLVPNFGDDRPDGATDFNDMAAHLGKEAVARFFSDQFAKGITPMSQPTNDNLLTAPPKGDAASPSSPPNDPPSIDGEPIIGKIVKFGKDNFKHDKSNSQSFFIEVDEGDNRTSELWGVDLERALAESGLAVGDDAELYKTGTRWIKRKVDIKDKDGKVIRQETREVSVNLWHIQPPQDAIRNIVKEPKPTTKKPKPKPEKEEPEPQEQEVPTPRFDTFEAQNQGTPPKYFTPQAFSEIHDIWKNVARLDDDHDATGYKITLPNKLGVTVTEKKVTIEKKFLKNPPDDVYVAACKQARRMWDGQMVVNGDIKHRMKAFVYAAVYGVEVTNYKPTTKELEQIKGMIESIRNDMPPSFERPQPKSRGSDPRLTL